MISRGLAWLLALAVAGLFLLIVVQLAQSRLPASSREAGRYPVREGLPGRSPPGESSEDARRGDTRRAPVPGRHIIRGLLCIHRHEGSWTDPNPPYYGGLR